MRDRDNGKNSKQRAGGGGKRTGGRNQTISKPNQKPNPGESQPFNEITSSCSPEVLAIAALYSLSHTALIIIVRLLWLKLQQISCLTRTVPLLLTIGVFKT